MLFWESEYPEIGVVHHLMVLRYHLQHPSLYSPQGLLWAHKLLSQFIDEGLTPAEVRRRNKYAVDSPNRTWKIKGTPDSHGAYPQPVRWTMTAADVVARGVDHYVDSVNAWARSVQEAIKAAG